ncbi:MAG TPA: GNAT family N-acetyltransferase [Feifaniaceae bacterium]|nr:GNAT family N-acetyltransferase [Feifaniaceae bacterium]
MQYAVEPLTPELAETFLTYFEALDFCHAPNWAACYCRFYHTDCPGEEWAARTGEQNRAEALESIKNGGMKGCLAFDGARCIGWCNANDIRAFVRLYADIAPYAEGKKAGCTVCYVIDPAYRSRGVARGLLKAAVEGFRREGFDFVLALPVEEQKNERRYRGTFHMYRELGFVELAREDGAAVLRLDLDCGGAH